MSQWEEGTEGFDSSGLLTDPYGMFNYKGKSYFDPSEKMEGTYRTGMFKRKKKTVDFKAMYETGSLTPSQIEEFKAWREKNIGKTIKQKSNWARSLQTDDLSFDLDRTKVPPPESEEEKQAYLQNMLSRLGSGRTDYNPEEKKIREFQSWFTDETTRGGRGQQRKSFLELMRNTREKYSSFRDRLASGWGY